jgi:hypothetical protein
VALIQGKKLKVKYIMKIEDIIAKNDYTLGSFLKDFLRKSSIMKLWFDNSFEDYIKWKANIICKAAGDFDVYENPDLRDIQELIRQGNEEVRFIADLNAEKLYVWSSEGSHADIARTLKIEYPYKDNLTFFGVALIQGKKLKVKYIMKIEDIIAKNDYTLDSFLKDFLRKSSIMKLWFDNSFEDYIKWKADIICKAA